MIEFVKFKRCSMPVPVAINCPNDKIAVLITDTITDYRIASSEAGVEVAKIIRRVWPERFDVEVVELQRVPAPD